MANSLEDYINGQGYFRHMFFIDLSHSVITGRKSCSSPAIK